MAKNEDDNDYLQVLDAGEHMYGIFVDENEDLYAYLSTEDASSSSSSFASSWMIPPTEDIEDIISRSIVPSPDSICISIDMPIDVDQDCSASFADLHIAGSPMVVGGGDVVPGSNDDNSETNETGRLTPTRNGDDDHDAMSE